jgi:AcrR family transcriptional regulator
MAAFAQAPYDQVSLAGIAVTAGSSEALVHRYFATKAELYVATVRAATEALLQRQQDADTALGTTASPWERLATSIEVYLDFVAGAPQGWAAPLRNPNDGPAEAVRLRAETREHYVELLRAVLGLTPDRRRDQVLHGYLGFIDAACLAWVAVGCPPEDRTYLVSASLSALEAALAAIS